MWKAKEERTFHHFTSATQSHITTHYCALIKIKAVLNLVLGTTKQKAYQLSSDFAFKNVEFRFAQASEQHVRRFDGMLLIF